MMMLADLLRLPQGHGLTLSYQDVQQLVATTPEELAHALGLSGHCRRKTRNQHLIQAAHLLAADGCSTWQAAGRLAEAIRVYHNELRPLLPDNQLPSYCTPVDRHIHQAFRAAGNGQMVTAQSKLYDLLKGKLPESE